MYKTYVILAAVIGFRIVGDAKQLTPVRDHGHRIIDYSIHDAIKDRISYDSYKIDIESADSSKDISMREAYGLDPEKAR